MDLAARTPSLRGLGIQEWLSFYFKAPDSAPGVYPEHDLFIQSMKLKNTLRHIMGQDLITHLRPRLLRRLAVALDLQLQTLLLYKALVEAREDWGGKLVLSCGRNSALSGVPAAASIAGATTLAIDSDATAVKTAMRRGEIDFVVNTLDEALRTLKNEIRQHRPLSVGLIMDVGAALNEIVERGVQPDLLLIPTAQSAHEVPSQSLHGGADKTRYALLPGSKRSGRWLI